MATLVGTGYIEIVPRLVGGFGPQLEAQMLGGTKAAGAAAAGEAEAAGLAGGRRYTNGMRGGLAGMAGMLKSMMGLAAVVGIADFAKKSVDAFKEVAGGAVTLQRVMGGTITQASEWQAVGERFGVGTQAMSVAMKTLSKDMVSGKGPLVALGIATKDVHGQMLPMGDVLMKVADKFKAMPDGALKSRLAVELFGKSGLTLLPILNKGSAGIQELMDAARKMGVVLDQSAIDKYKKMVVAQKDLHESVLGLKVAFGEQLVPALTAVTQWVTNSVIPALRSLLDFIIRNRDVIEPLVKAFLGLVIAVKAVNTAVAACRATVAAFNAVMLLARSASAAFGTAMTLATGPIGIIVVAIAAVVAAVVLLWMHWNEVWNWIGQHKAYAVIIGILTGPIVLPIFALVAALKFLQSHWNEIWSSLRAAVQSFVDFFVALPGRIVSGLSTAWNAIVDFFVKLPGRIVGALTALPGLLVSAGKAIIAGLWNGITTTASVLWDFFKALPGRIMGFLGFAVGLLIRAGMDIIKGLWNGITTAIPIVWNFFTSLPGRIMDFIKNAGTWLLHVGQDIIHGLGSGISAGSGVVTDFFAKLPGRITGFLKDAGTWLLTIGHDILTGLWNGLQTAAAAVWNFFTALPGRLLGFIKDAGSWLVTTGKDIIAGLFRGIGDAIKDVGVWIWQNIVYPFIHGIESALGIASPSTKMMSIGVDIIKGLFEGILSVVKNIATWLWNNVGAPLIGFFAKGATWLIDKGKEILGGLFKGMASVATGIGGWVANNVIKPLGNALGFGGDGGPSTSSSVGLQWGHGLSLGITTGLVAEVPGFTKAVGMFVAITQGIATGARTAQISFGKSMGLIVGATEDGQRRAAVEMGLMVASMAGMAEGTVKSSSTSVSAMQRQQRATDLLAADAAMRMGQIIGNLLGMAGGTETSTGRADNAMERQQKAQDALAANAAMRMGQIIGGMGSMASATESATGRAIGAFIRMQGSVDSLHGKNIQVNAGADVQISQHVIDMTKQLGIAFRAADGGFLPSHATIARPTTGRGLVQWAEPETGGEAFIPLAPQKRKRSVEIWRTTGELLGQFATGGLLNIALPDINSAEWLRSFPAFQSDAEGIATSLGQKIDNKVGAKIGTALTQKITDTLAMMVAALQAGSGGGSATGVADSNAVVAFAKTLIGDPYRPPYYDPSGFSCDGLVWYVFRHFGINLPTGATNQMNAVQRLQNGQQQPGDVVGFHQDGPSSGNPLGLEFHHIGLVTGMDQMIDALGSAYGVRVDSISNINSGPGAYVRFGRVLQNLNPGWTPGGPGIGAGAAFGGGAMSREQVAALVAGVGLPAHMVDVAYKESGWNSGPASDTYSGIPGNTAYGLWQILAPMNQWAWNAAGWRSPADYHNPLIDARAAKAVFDAAGPSAWASTWANGGIRGVSYDAGGWLPPGLSMAYNGTGKPEPVGNVGTTQHNTVNLTMHIANGDPVTMKAAAQQVVDDALTALARRLSSGAGRN